MSISRVIQGQQDPSTNSALPAAHRNFLRLDLEERQYRRDDAVRPNLCSDKIGYSV